MENCLFCKIANGEIPSFTLYEDDEFKVILDKFPGSKGHMLVIPKEHAENIFDLPEEKAEKAFKLVKKMAKKIKDNLNIEGLNIVQNNGKAAGQSVFHFHIHLIPRYKGDKVNIKWEPKEASDEELKEIRDLINRE